MPTTPSAPAASSSPQHPPETTPVDPSRTENPKQFNSARGGSGSDAGGTTVRNVLGAHRLNLAARKVERKEEEEKIKARQQRHP